MILPWTHSFLMLMTTQEMNWSVVLLAVASICAQSWKASMRLKSRNNALPARLKSINFYFEEEWEKEEGSDQACNECLDCQS